MEAKRTPFASALGLFVLFSAVCVAACGPKCPEVKSSLSEDEALKGDVGRVNSLVAKRKAAMTEASSSESAANAVSKLKFSVTAYELAIETQLRIIKISPKYDDASVYGENQAVFNEMRCFFDGLVADAESHVVSQGTGSEIQKWSQRVAEILQGHGRLSSYELRDYLENGIQAPGDKNEAGGGDTQGGEGSQESSDTTDTTSDGAE